MHTPSSNAVGLATRFQAKAKMESKKSCRSQHKSRSTARLSNLTLDKAVEHELKHGINLDPNIDRKQLRRTISNRLSAQRSRIRKCQYAKDMEKMVKDLQELISVITPQIDNYKEMATMLLLQNESLKKLIECRTNELKMSEIEIERNQAEVCRLRELERSAYDDNGYPYYNLELKIGSSSSSGIEERLLGFPFKLPFETSTPKNNQEEADVDQYFNFEQLNIDQGSG